MSTADFLITCCSDYLITSLVLFTFLWCLFIWHALNQLSTDWVVDLKLQTISVPFECSSSGWDYCRVYSFNAMSSYNLNVVPVWKAPLNQLTCAVVHGLTGYNLNVVPVWVKAKPITAFNMKQNTLYTLHVTINLVHVVGETVYSLFCCA